MKGAVFLSILDQALLSAFNLALNLAFIAWSTPADFGRFVLVQSAAFFAISAQNALIVMPLNYLLPGRPVEEAERQLSLLTSVNLALTAATLLAGLGLGIWLAADATLHAAILAYLATILLREYARNLQIVRGRVDRALIGDGLTVLVSAALILLLWPLLQPVGAVLTGMAGGTLAALIINRIDMRFAPRAFLGHLASYRAIWRETRWALQGALQHEVEVRSYVFLVERWRDAATLGILQAGRVALAPLSLIGTAWRRVARPRIVEALHHGRESEALRLIWFGAAVMTGATAAYGAALLLAWPLIETYVFRGRYGDMSGIVFCWWLYTAVTGLVTVPVTLMEARRRFKALAAIGFVMAALIVGVLCALLFIDFTVESVVLSLTAVHVVELATLLFFARRRPAENPSARPA